MDHQAKSLTGIFFYIIIVMLFFLVHITIASPVNDQVKKEINHRMPDSSEFVFPDDSTQGWSVKQTTKAMEPPRASSELLKDVRNVTVTPVKNGNLTTPGWKLRNAITVPAECKEGFRMGGDGVCREVW